MDFSDLDDLLDEGGYVPTFGKSAKPPPTKTLLKNNSSKSIDSLALPPPPPNTRTNMLQIHKDTRKEVTTFEDFLKQGKDPSPKPSAPPKPPNDLPPRTQRSSSPLKAEKREEVNINSLLDEEEEAVGSRRGMRPPLSKKNNDSRSVASRRNDDNKSMDSVADIKPPLRGEDKPRVVEETPSLTGTLFQSGEWRKVLEEQLLAQREISDRLMKEQQSLHKTELQRQAKLHQQELRRKLQLKELQISNIKENFELKLKTLSHSQADTASLEAATNKLSQGLQAIERAELQLKNQSLQLSQDSEQKQKMASSIHQQSVEQEQSFRHLMEGLENRERDFREERGRAMAQIDRQRVRNQQNEARLIRRERELEDKLNSRERVLQDEIEQKKRQLTEEEAALRMARTQFEYEKQRFHQEREESLLRTKRNEETRAKAAEELLLEKTKLLTREAEVSSRQQEWQAKTEELLYREKQLEGKMRLVQAQRKKWEAQRDIGGKTGGFSSKGSRFSGLPARSFQEVVPAALEKSLKQLKDEYLRNLGHI